MVIYQHFNALTLHENGEPLLFPSCCVLFTRNGMYATWQYQKPFATRYQFCRMTYVQVEVPVYDESSTLRNYKRIGYYTRRFLAEISNAAITAGGRVLLP